MGESPGGGLQWPWQLPIEKTLLRDRIGLGASASGLMALSREPGNLSVELSILISFQPQIDKESVRAIGGR